MCAQSSGCGDGPQSSRGPCVAAHLRRIPRATPGAVRRKGGFGARSHGELEWADIHRATGDLSVTRTTSPYGADPRDVRPPVYLQLHDSEAAAAPIETMGRRAARCGTQ